MLFAHAITAIGSLIASLGLVAVIRPGLMQKRLAISTRRGGLYLGGIFRLVSGTVLVFGSWECSWPQATMLVGLLLVAAGAVGVSLGRPRLEAVIAWFITRPDGIIRGWGIVSGVLGGFIVYAAIG